MRECGTRRFQNAHERAASYENTTIYQVTEFSSINDLFIRDVGKLLDKNIYELAKSHDLTRSLVSHLITFLSGLVTNFVKQPVDVAVNNKARFG